MSQVATVVQHDIRADKALVVVALWSPQIHNERHEARAVAWQHSLSLARAMPE
jgi:hypothetical protein